MRLRLIALAATERGPHRRRACRRRFTDTEVPIEVNFPLLKGKGHAEPRPAPPDDDDDAGEPARLRSPDEKSDLRNHQAIVQPRFKLFDCLMVTQITLNTEPGTPRARSLPGTLSRKSRLGVSRQA